MYLLVIILPLLNSLILGFLGRFIGIKGLNYFSIFFSFITALISYFIFYDIVLKNSICLILGYNWITSGFFFVNWVFLFDSLSSIMLCIILTVSCLVQIYSLEYMKGDAHILRFMSYLSLFTFFMVILVTSGNFLQLFMGWEGVGLCSFLLISFWFTRNQANKSSIKAIIVNKIGDFGILVAILAIYDVFGNLDFLYVFELSLSKFNDFYIFFDILKINKITFITLMLFLGAIGKSAQLGLHTWLPDAMEGPTPVSALIHAATMVTAGVFLIIRMSFLFELSKSVLNLIVIFGALTCFFAATTAILQNDLKKVIAYSTCSQLGYMIFSCGLSNYQGALFHLSNHAFFKALLFLSAGSVIHALNNEQDMRRLGGLLKIMPFTYTMFLIGSLALAGFPFLSGFYSKDFILEFSFSNYNFFGFFSYWLGVFSGFCTAFYSFRLIFFTFYSKTNNYKAILEGVHESSSYMLFSLCILCLGSIFIGYITKDIFIGFGNFTFYKTIFNNPIFNLNILSEFIPIEFKLIPVFSSFLGIILSITIYSFFIKYFIIIQKNVIFLKFYYFFSKKWYFDVIYNKFLVNFILFLGYKITYQILDKGLFEIIGPLGIQKFLTKFLIFFYKLETGFIYHYFFFIFTNVVLILTYYIYYI
jgi:NADH-ubiquinone oxidoreductase chain 5